MGAQPGHREDAGGHAQLHQGAVEGQDLLGLGEIQVDLLGDLAEFLLLVLLPHEGLDHPDAQQVLLHHVVHPVVLLEHTLKDGMGAGHNEQQAQRQDGDHNQENQGQLGVDGKGHCPGADEHDGTAHRDADDHHEGHLHVGYVGGQAGDDAAGGVLINIGKGKFLDVGVHLPPQVAGQAGGRLGREPAGKGAQQQGHQGHGDDRQTVEGDVVHAASLHALVQQPAGHGRDQYVKDYLADDENRR